MRVVPCVLRPQVQLDRQLKVVHTVAVAQHYVQFAQGVATVTDCQVGRQQLDAGCLAQGKLPQPFVVKPQPPAAELCQPLAQRAIVGIQLPQPALQALRLLRPEAARQRVALGAGRGAEQGRRQQGPGQVAHGGAA
ncbi:hypothetical protein D3C81_1576060 [compost metagenome]